MTETAPEEKAAPQQEPLGTYFVVGVSPSGEPALYLSPEVAEFSRERVASLLEARRVLETVTEEVRIRTLAATVSAAVMAELNQPKPTPGDMTAEALRKRMED